MALLSIQALEDLADRHRLTPPQCRLITSLACASLTHNHVSKYSVGTASPLVDGTSAVFCRLLRILRLQRDRQFTHDVFAQILSLNKIDVQGTKAVLRFLALCLRVPSVLSASARATVEAVYSRILLLALASETRRDALRVLMLLTTKRHVRRDRLTKVRVMLPEAEPLLRLYASLRPDLDIHTQSTTIPTWYSFPDVEWQELFQGDDGAPEKKQKRDTALAIVKGRPFLTTHLADERFIHWMIQETDENFAATIHVLLPLFLQEAWTTSRRTTLYDLQVMARRSQYLPPSIEDFVLDTILPMWDGTDLYGRILCHDLLPLLAFRSVSDLRKRLLKPLASTVKDASTRIIYHVISVALTGLVRRWNEQQGTSDGIREIVKWTELVSLQILTHEDHELTRMALIDFYSVVSSLAIAQARLPHPLVANYLLLSSSTTIDGYCSMIVGYRQVMVRCKKEGIHLDRVELYNRLIWDLCSSLWRSSSPSSDDAKKLSLLYSKDTLGDNALAVTLMSAKRVSASLSLHQGMLWSGWAATYSPTGPMSTCCRSYLDYLGRTVGFDGVNEFLKTYVESLVPSS